MQLLRDCSAGPALLKKTSMRAKLGPAELIIIEVAGTGSEVYIEVEIDIDWRPLGRSWTFAGRSWSSLGGILAGASGQNAA